jgi:hypothetical protein
MNFLIHCPCLWATFPRLAEGVVFVVAAPAAFSAAREALDDFNVAIAELSQTEAVVSSLVLGYMFLGRKIERMVRGN